MEFELDVVSDAGWSVFGERIPLLRVAEQLAAHDLGMVKPALLYADRVTLHSGNFFIASQIEGYLTRSYMPMQVVALLGHLAARQRDELLKIGITDTDLPPQDEAEQAMRDWRAHVRRAEADPSVNFVFEFVTPLADRWDVYFGRVMPRLVEALEEEQESLFSPQLDLARDEGLLEVRPHTVEPPNLNRSPNEVIFGESPLSYQDRAAAEVLSLVAASGAVLLDPWSTELLDVFGLGASARRSAAADLGVRLLAPLPTVARASISEILDLRRELQGPLIRFRSAMATAAKEMPDASVEREDFVTAFLDEQVAPALLEIDERTRENSFVSQLLDVVKDPKEMAVPAGGLLVASGAGITGVLGVVSGLTGMTIPVLRTLVRMSREKQEIARNPFYFLHRLDSVHAG